MAIDWEEIVVKGIIFLFKNHPEYIEETEELKSHFKRIIPDLERYLMNKEVIEMRREQLQISRKCVLVWLIHPKVDNGSENQKVGKLSFCEDNQLIIQIYPFMYYKREELMSMFIHTLIHEIFHLFFEDETLVHEKTKEFINSIPYLYNLWKKGILLNKKV